MMSPRPVPGAAPWPARSPKRCDHRPGPPAGWCAACRRRSDDRRAIRRRSGLAPGARHSGQWAGERRNPRCRVPQWRCAGARDRLHRRPLANCAASTASMMSDIVLFLFSGGVRRRTASDAVSSSPGVVVQTWAWPPSTKNSAPATKLASSEARKATAFAISAGSATRPIGTWVAM